MIDKPQPIELYLGRLTALLLKDGLEVTVGPHGFTRDNFVVQSYDARNQNVATASKFRDLEIETEPLKMAERHHEDMQNHRKKVYG